MVEEIEKRKCCFCGHKPEPKEKMFAQIYGGGKDKVDWLYQCIRTVDCIKRVRRNYELDAIVNSCITLK